MEMKAAVVLAGFVGAWLLFEAGYWLGKTDQRQETERVALCLNDDGIRELKLANQPIPPCAKADHGW
jgi:hypothetical protein